MHNFKVHRHIKVMPVLHKLQVRCTNRLNPENNTDIRNIQLSPRESQRCAKFLSLLVNRVCD